MKIFTTIVTGLQQLTIVVKSFILDLAGFLDLPLRFMYNIPNIIYFHKIYNINTARRSRNSTTSKLR